MKLLEKAVLEPAYQGIMHSNPGRLDNNRRNETTDNIFSSPLFFRLYNELKHLCRRIGVIRVPSTHTALGEIFRHQSAPPRHTDHPDDYQTDKNTPVIFDDIRMPWVRTEPSSRYHAYLTVNRLKTGRHHLAGRSVLCIGGRAALYPDYHRLIEAAGGHFIVFRGGAQDNTECLLALLDCVNIVICPADCINHEDFFTVRRYCQRTRKYCAILARSDLATFSKAVENLAQNCRHYISPGPLNQSAA